MSLKLPEVDPARLEAEWAADKTVLAELAASGDDARIPRPVDVSFRGSEMDFERLLNVASQFGFVELDREESDDGELYLFLECEQAVDEASIRKLARTCVQLEMVFGLEYDGWGCQAKPGTVQ